MPSKHHSSYAYCIQAFPSLSKSCSAASLDNIHLLLGERQSPEPLGKLSPVKGNFPGLDAAGDGLVAGKRAVLLGTNAILSKRSREVAGRRLRVRTRSVVKRLWYGVRS